MKPGTTARRFAERRILEAAIKRDVMWLAEHGNMTAVDDVLVAIGFCTSKNGGDETPLDVARAVVALMDVVQLGDLRDAAGSAAFGRAWFEGAKLDRSTRYAAATRALNRMRNLPRLQAARSVA